MDLASSIFRTGRIFPKPGNEDVLVYSITSRRAIVERVIPFFEKYVLPYGSELKRKNFEMFRTATELLEKGAHKTQEGVLQLIDLAYSTNHAGKQRKLPKEIVIQRILRGHTPESTARG